MESDQSSINPSQLLNQYVFRMESEIGCSARTLHQIVSEYLSLKTQNPSLLHQVEDLEIPSAEKITAEQFEHWTGKLRRLQTLRKRVLQGINSVSEHPWYGIAHCNHKPEEIDALLRTVRFVLIQLNKVWVEIQSVPLFLNALDQSPISEIERIFRWLLSSPNWSELISHPRVIPLLAQVDSRKILLDFIRDVRSVRVLRSKLESLEDSGFLDHSLIHKGVGLLTEGTNLVKRHHLGHSSRSNLDAKEAALELNISRLDRIQSFFWRISSQKSFPSENGAPKTGNQVRRIFLAATLLRKMPNRVISIRNGKILEKEQLGNIEAWKNQVGGILDTRKRLKYCFRLEDPYSADELRKLAGELTSAGTLRTFSASYQGALHRYQNLLRVDLHNSARKKKRETPAEMSSRLLEWASYLDEVKTFETQPGLRQVFGTSFKGIDTDFELACQANVWISQFRADLKADSDPFAKLLADYFVNTSEATVLSIMDALSDETTQELEKCLNELEIPGEAELSEVSANLNGELLELRRLSNILDQLRIESELKLGSLEEYKNMTEEVVFLCKRMESNTELKQWLKSAYRGPDTDLSLIEQGLVYVQYLESAQIPDSLKSAFISGYGPQRINESRNLLSSTWASLETLNDLFHKFEVCTYGQSKKLVTLPVPVLLARIQQALKQSSLIQDWVEYLQCEQDVRSQGLSVLLDYYEKRSLLGWSLEAVFELAYITSLLKQGIQRNNAEFLEGQRQSWE